MVIPLWTVNQHSNVVTNVMQEWLLSNPNPDKPELTNDEFLFYCYWPILEQTPAFFAFGAFVPTKNNPVQIIIMAAPRGNAQLN